MVAVAQLVESWIVIPVVVGSSPIGHPIESRVSSIVLADISGDVAFFVASSRTFDEYSAM